MTDIQSRYASLAQSMQNAYEARFPQSAAAHARARQILVDGISHGARLFKPYPFRVVAAQGAYVRDLDGHEIIDYWQGHYANILGHNPAVVREALIHSLEEGYGLQTGLPEERQTEYAWSLAKAVGAESVRLTTAGTLATMYAMMLARAYTNRTVVLKVAGGWHGANPLALKGVHRSAHGYDEVDSAGIPEATEREVLVIRFNDVEGLHAAFRAHGDRIACFILEPCPSNAGFIPATVEFMAAARALTARHGALLILDEVITGFRFCAGGAQKLYGVQPDLSTYGKIIGGGMPLSAIAGRADIMAQASEASGTRVWFNGGTFSAHPLCVLAGQVMVNHLVAHESEIYPALAAKGERLRSRIERSFAERGLSARCTGHPSGAIKGSSLGSVYFPQRDDLKPSCAEDMTDPNLCDMALRDRVLKLGLLLHGVNAALGMGAVSLSHTDEDLERTAAAYDWVAEQLAAQG